MSATASSQLGQTTATIDRQFGEKLLTCFDNPQAYGVHMLFNDWWEYAPYEVVEKYAADFMAVPEQAEFVRAQHFAPNHTLEELKAYAPGTLGRGFYHFIADNGLEPGLATNYQGLHTMMAASGKLDRMPQPLQYAIIRGFQLHDLLHVLTDYEATPEGEIALQAFCLAQLRFPYFAMWMSVVTSRMTFLDPDTIQPMMDAISDGWSYGRRTKNLQFARWEEQFDRPIDELRREYGLERDQPFRLAA